MWPTSRGKMSNLVIFDTRTKTEMAKLHPMIRQVLGEMVCLHRLFTAYPPLSGIKDSAWIYCSRERQVQLLMWTGKTGGLFTTERMLMWIILIIGRPKIRMRNIPAFSLIQPTITRKYHLSG